MTAVPDRRRLLLVGWDAVDWGTVAPLLASGALPHLSRLIAQGTVAELTTLYPVNGPLLWTSAATGVTADRHGVLGYARADQPADDARERPRLVTPADRAAPALWDFVARRGGKSHVVNWPCSYPTYEVGGLHVSDAAARGLAVETFDEIRSLPGWMVAPPPFAREEGEALRMAAGEVEPTVLARFLSDGGWVPRWLPPALAACFTVHNFATLALESGDDWDLAAIRYPGLLPLAVARARGGSDTARDSAARDGLLRLHDLFLGRLVELAERSGPQTAILLVSAYGFPARMVGDETDVRAGLLVLGQHSAPVSSARLLGAGLLDIAPTALNVLGFEPTVAARAEMRGHALTAPAHETPAFPPTSSTVDSAISGAVMPWKSATLTPEASADALIALQSEGLVSAEQATNDARAAQSVFLSQLWTQARVLSYAGKSAESIPLLQRLLARMPQNVDALFLLTVDLQTAGRREEARKRIAPLLAPEADVRPEVKARAYYFAAEDALRDGKRGAALSHLRQASTLATTPGLLLGIGRDFYHLRRYADADACFVRVLDIDPTEPIAWMGHAGMAALLRQYEDAVVYARRAIALRHDSALSHLILARALRATNRRENAREARGAYTMAMRLGIHARSQSIDASLDVVV